MKFNLPTQPNHPPWEEGETPPLGMWDSSGREQQRTPGSHRPKPRARPWHALKLPRQICLLVLLTISSAISYSFVSRFVLTAVVVQGRSMAPTLEDGERYILNRWIYYCRDPRRGDLVVLRDPGHQDLAAKRIVAMPSEFVEVKQGAIFVNGHRLIEPYLSLGTETFALDRRDQSVMMGKNQYFVLGDNRAMSEDSRCYGAVRRDQIIGLLFK